MKLYGYAKKIIIRTIGKSFKRLILGDFTFSIPDGKKAQVNLYAQTYNTGNSIYLIDETTWSSLYNLFRSNSDLLKDQLCKGYHSFFKLDLPYSADETDRGFKFDLAIKSKFNNRRIIAIAANCDRNLDVEYNIRFLNPGSIFTRHFSQNDRYILETHTVITFAIVLFTFMFYKKMRKLYANNSKVPSILTCYLLSLILFTAGMTLKLFNSITYAFDGTNLSALLFLSEFAIKAANIIQLGSLFGIQESIKIPMNKKLTDLTMAATVLTTLYFIIWKYSYYFQQDSNESFIDVNMLRIANSALFLTFTTLTGFAIMTIQLALNGLTSIYTIQSIIKDYGFTLDGTKSFFCSLLFCSACSVLSPIITLLIPMFFRHQLIAIDTIINLSTLFVVYNNMDLFKIITNRANNTNKMPTLNLNSSLVSQDDTATFEKVRYS